jgi:hypothetical protein
MGNRGERRRFLEGDGRKEKKNGGESGNDTQTKKEEMKREIEHANDRRIVDDRIFKF